MLRLPLFFIAAGFPVQMVNGAPSHACGDGERFEIHTGSLKGELMPYSRCLSGAKQGYGFNDGPIAVAQCAKLRHSVLTATESGQAPRTKRLLDELDHKFVWQNWCSTDVGRNLPAHIRISPSWPQAQRSPNASNR